MNLTFFDANRALAFTGIQTLIAITNAILMKRLDRFPGSRLRPSVSVLIPARNEEATIAECVGSLLAQDYPDFDIWVLDDQSTDRTREILAGLSSGRLHTVSGAPLPEGWVGKSWACHQLARQAPGELLLFTDADTTHKPVALRSAVDALEATGSDLVTAVTHNDVRSLAEALTVPFPTWSVFSLLPLSIAYWRKRSAAFTAANGKFMLFRRKAYEAIGGHAAIRGDAVEDIALGKLIKRNGLRWRLLDAVPLVTCRMYHGLREAVAGFTKNYFALFGYRVLVAGFVWCWLLLLTWYPLAVLAYSLLRPTLHPEAIASLSTVGLTWLLWVMTAARFRFPGYLFLLYPFTVTLSAFIGFRSIVLTIAGRTAWKGRGLPGTRARLI